MVKETFDTEAKIVLEDPATISTKDIKYIINPYDEFAIEEALRIREKFGGEIILYSVGRKESENTIRNGLALGADEGKIIISLSKESIIISSLLASAIAHEKYDLILSGWIAIDDNNAQVPARISQLLGIPLINTVKKLEINDNRIICQRENDENLEIIEAGLPAIIAVQRGINEPRYPTVKNILEAKKKKVEFITNDYQENWQAAVTYQLPYSQREGFTIDGSEPQKAVHILVDRLKKAKVL